MGKRSRVVMVAMASLIACFTTESASAVVISNGIVGDGLWQVDVREGGQTDVGNVDPAGPIGSTDVVFSYRHFIQVGSRFAFNMASFTSSAPTLTGTNEVTSSGSISGINDTIHWQSVSTIAADSQIYSTEMTFNSASPFGEVRLTQYLHESVAGASDNVLIQLGTPGADDFRLMNLDAVDDFGVSHGASYNDADGMNYLGWAAGSFPGLLNRITVGSQAFDVDGVVSSFPATTDGRHPGAPAWGPSEISSAIAFDFDPSATFGSVTFTLGGSIDGTLPTAIPEPATSSVLFVLGVGVLLRRRRSA